MTTLNSTEKFIIKSDFAIILGIMQVKNTVKNVDWIFLKMADQSYLGKIVLIMDNICSQADIEALLITKCRATHSNKQTK